MRTILRHTFKMASAVVILLTMLAYVCPMVNPSDFRWFAFFGTAFPYLLFCNLILLCIWVWRWNRFSIYHAVILLFGWPHITGFIGLDTENDVIPETAITVATHNLGGLFRGQKMTDALREKTVNAYARFLQDNGFPDLLCTQETSGKFYRLLSEKMGYQHTFNLKKGTVILSRYPIEAGGDIPFEKTANSTLWADIRINGKLVRIYNVHLQSNKVTTATEKVIEEGELDESRTWRDIGFVLTRVGSATSIRAEQALKLREHINACKHPVIICGDFNDTPNSYVYSLLSGGFTDTFRQKGWGFGTTFAGALPLLRIDYILTEKTFTTHNCRTIRGDFSDHFPVFVAIGL